MAAFFDRFQNAWVNTPSNTYTPGLITPSAAGQPVFDPSINAWIKPGQNFNTPALVTPGTVYFSLVKNGWVTA